MDQISMLQWILLPPQIRAQLAGAIAGNPPSGQRIGDMVGRMSPQVQAQPNYLPPGQFTPPNGGQTDVFEAIRSAVERAQQPGMSQSAQEALRPMMQEGRRGIEELQGQARNQRRQVQQAELDVLQQNQRAAQAAVPPQPQQRAENVFPQPPQSPPPLNVNQIPGMGTVFPTPPPMPASSNFNSVGPFPADQPPANANPWVPIINPAEPTLNPFTGLPLMAEADLARQFPFGVERAAFAPAELPIQQPGWQQAHRFPRPQPSVTAQPQPQPLQSNPVSLLPMEAITPAPELVGEIPPIQERQIPELRSKPTAQPTPPVPSASKPKPTQPPKMGEAMAPHIRDQLLEEALRLTRERKGKI